MGEGPQREKKYATNESLSYPPETISPKDLGEMLDSLRGDERSHSDRVLPEIKLMKTAAWSNYVNFEHFGPLTFEGIPEGHTFDYSWDKTLTPEERQKRLLPAAEVTESGQFLLWDNYCNYYEIPAARCRSTLQLIFRHEVRHYQQWRKLAPERPSSPSRRKKPVSDLSSLLDLEKMPGAKVEFMKKWGNGPHYQCREVEVYTDQYLDKEITAAHLSAARLKRLEGYFKGCRQGPWKAEFEPAMKNAERLFADLKYEISN